MVWWARFKSLSSHRSRLRSFVYRAPTGVDRGFFVVHTECTRVACTRLWLFCKPHRLTARYDCAAGNSLPGRRRQLTSYLVRCSVFRAATVSLRLAGKHRILILSAPKTFSSWFYEYLRLIDNRPPLQPKKNCRSNAVGNGNC